MKKQKRKTWEELYGVEESNRRKEKLRKRIVLQNKNLEFKEKARPKIGRVLSEGTRKKISLGVSKSQKGKSWEERMGKEKADELKKRLANRKSHLGFKHSEETKEKISQKKIGRKQPLCENIKQKQNQMGRIFSEETKKKISNSMKGDNNPSKRIEVRAKQSKSHMGIETWNKGKTKKEFPQLTHVVTEEHKQRMSILIKNAWRNPEKRKRMTENNKGKYKGGFIKDLGHYCRGRFEANYARFLKMFDMEYEYEPKVFELSGNNIYIPDFYLAELDMYIETKGYMREDAKIKIDKFKKEHFDVKWSMIYQHSKEWKQIVKDYSQQIPYWEYDKRERALI